jgi:hypothetical protein
MSFLTIYTRLNRIRIHLFTYPCRWLDVPYWLFELFFLFLDLLGVFTIYEILASWVKWNTRSLNPEERRIARSVFGDAIDLDQVRIDDRAFVGSKQYHFAYVSFHTVNSWGALDAGILIHELMHIWQYQQLGAVYIPKALRAQRSVMGYNYGGVAMLREHLRGGLVWFNLEQQADLVTDYFRLKNGLPTQWGHAGLQDLELYEVYMEEVRKPGTDFFKQTQIFQGGQG